MIMYEITQRRCVCSGQNAERYSYSPLLWCKGEKKVLEYFNELLRNRNTAACTAHFKCAYVGSICVRVCIYTSIYPCVYTYMYAFTYVHVQKQNIMHSRLRHPVSIRGGKQSRHLLYFISSICNISSRKRRQGRFNTLYAPTEYLAPISGGDKFGREDWKAAPDVRAQFPWLLQSTKSYNTSLFLLNNCS